MFKIIKSKRGEMTSDTIAILVLSMLVIAFALHALPVIVDKQKLDTYATELCRVAEISGRVGEETTEKAQGLTGQTGLNPTISWSQNGKIQLGDQITVTLHTTKDIGFFTFGSFPIELTAKASGKSEVFWK